MRKVPHNVSPKKELEKDNKFKFILCLLSTMLRLHCVMRDIGRKVYLHLGSQEVD